MRRVAVIGSSSGSGKTTFGRALAARIGVPFTELDALAWGPNWTIATTEQFLPKVQRVLETDAWVIDGNYTGRLGDVVWRRADTIVWLDIPLRVTLWRTFRRTLRRALTREVLWSGNRESFWKAFAGRDSLFVYAVRTYRRRRRMFEARLRGFPQVAVHRFRSTAEADRWLASLPNEREDRSDRSSLRGAAGTR